MTEQIEIMDMINRWGYLNLEQIALLLNKNIETTEKKTIYINEKEINNRQPVNSQKRILLTHKDNTFLGRCVP